MPDSTVSLVAPYPSLAITTSSDQVTVDLTAPQPTLAVTTAQGGTATVSVETTVQDSKLAVTAYAGNTSTVELVAPKPELELQTGATVELVGESTLEVTALSGGTASVSLTAPLAALGIDAQGDQVGSVSLQPDLPTLAVSAASGSVATVELEAVPPTLLITSFGIGESVVVLEAPLPDLEVTALTGISSTITLVAPEPELLVWADINIGLLGSYATWCMNVENSKVSAYTEFPFNSLVQWGGQYYGVGSDGIYLLEGSDDNGTNIDSEIKFGYDDLGTDQFKRAPHVYVGCKAEGDLRFTVSVDGGAEYATTFSPQAEGIHNTRVKPGRGHRGRYWQPGLLNVEGVDFEFASMNLVEEVIQRRVN